MALAANAILDAIAPQPRRAQAAPGDDTAGFEDALARAAPHDDPRPAHHNEPHLDDAQVEADTDEHKQDDGEEAAPASAVDTATQTQAHRQPQFLLQLIAAQAQAATMQAASAETSTEAATQQPGASTMAAQVQSTPPTTPAKPARPARHGKQDPSAMKSNAPANGATPAQKTAEANVNAAGQTQTPAQAASAPAAAPVVADATPLIAPLNAEAAPAAQKSAAPKTAAIDTSASSPTRDAKVRGAAAAKPEAPALTSGERGGAPAPRDAAAAPSKPPARAAGASSPAQTASTNSTTATPPQAPATPTPPETPRASSDSMLQTALRAAPVAAQVGHEIVRRFNGESTRFEMRLDPPELGRIEVKLDVTRDHRVTAVVSADNPQALSDLSRATRDLQQALQSAGLELADNGLSFDLSDRRGEAFANAEQQRAETPRNQTLAANDEPQTIARPVRLESWRGARIDLMA